MMPAEPSHPSSEPTIGDRMVIARRPEFTGEPSPGQLAVREKFRAAAAYARGVLADSATQALYPST